MIMCCNNCKYLNKSKFEMNKQENGNLPYKKYYCEKKQEYYVSVSLDCEDKSNTNKQLSGNAQLNEQGCGEFEERNDELSTN